jgi:hypothetical protein
MRWRWSGLCGEIEAERESSKGGGNGHSVGMAVGTAVCPLMNMMSGLASACAWIEVLPEHLFAVLDVTDSS